LIDSTILQQVNDQSDQQSVS